MLLQADKGVLGTELGAPCSLVRVAFRIEGKPAVVSNNTTIKMSTWVE